MIKLTAVCNDNESTTIHGPDGSEWMVTANGRFLYRRIRGEYVQQDWESWPFEQSPIDLACEAGAARWGKARYSMGTRPVKRVTRRPVKRNPAEEYGPGVWAKVTKEFGG